MIWMDVRSARQADAIAATKDPALRVNGAGSGPVSAEWLIPKSLWIKETQRELFDRTEKIGEYRDYINLRLTGRWVDPKTCRCAGTIRATTAAGGIAPQDAHA